MIKSPEFWIMSKCLFLSLEIISKKALFPTNVPLLSGTSIKFNIWSTTPTEPCLCSLVDLPTSRQSTQNPQYSHLCFLRRTLEKTTYSPLKKILILSMWVTLLSAVGSQRQYSKELLSESCLLCSNKFNTLLKWPKPMTGWNMSLPLVFFFSELSFERLSQIHKFSDACVSRTCLELYSKSLIYTQLWIKYFCL